MRIEKNILVFILIFCFSILSLPSVAVADQYDQLRKEYLTLRNTDPDLQRSAAWTALSDRIFKQVDFNPKSILAPTALLDVATINEKLYRRFGGLDRLKIAIAAMERLAKEYTGNVLVDDALVRLGDIYLNDLKDTDLARRSFLEVVDAYPASDMALVARARLDAISKGIVKPQEKKVALPTSKNNLVIVLDPGHGGEDFGAKGVGGLLEKDVTLDIAKRLKPLLETKLKATVRLTRTHDQFVALADRTAMANDFEADLFVSLHNNASPGGKLSGIEVYYLDNTDDQSSKKLAARENQAGASEVGDDIGFILSDLIQSAKLDDSIALANILDRSLVRQFKPTISGFRNYGAKKAPFYVLVGAHMPCVLVELFFIDNAKDGKLLADKDFRQEIAIALSIGLGDFVNKNISAARRSS